MNDPRSTCWTMIQAAADGDAREQEAFARAYEPAIRAYLGARWRGGALRAELDDAVQEVFVECYRDGGVLAAADRSRDGGFRAFLFGVVRNVARRMETRRGRRREQSPPTEMALDGQPGAEDPLSVVFDRAWAQRVMREAARRQARDAKQSGAEAERRVELLRLRFQEGLPIRDIARRWEVEPDWLHHQYAQARTEFRRALLEVLGFYHPGAGGAATAERECTFLLGLLE